MALVIGLVGASATGKSSLVEALSLHTSISCVSCDHHYKPKDQCPVFDLSKLPWPEDYMPEAFKARGNHDLNHPAAVDWEGVVNAIDEAKRERKKRKTEFERINDKDTDTTEVIVVEGLLLLADDPGAARLRENIDKYVLLSYNDDKLSRQALWQRKYKRSGHLSGHLSYAERGVSEAAYEVYFEGAVESAWQRHGGEARIAKCKIGLDDSDTSCTLLRLNCHRPLRENVLALLATGWFGTFDRQHEGLQGEEGRSKVKAIKLQRERPEADLSSDSGT